MFTVFCFYFAPYSLENGNQTFLLKWNFFTRCLPFAFALEKKTMLAENAHLLEKLALARLARLPRLPRFPRLPRLPILPADIRSRHCRDCRDCRDCQDCRLCDIAEIAELADIAEIADNADIADIADNAETAGRDYPAGRDYLDCPGCRFYRVSRDCRDC